jgi:hypothetical protein
LSPGGPAITINDLSYSVAHPTALISGNNVIPLYPGIPSVPDVLTIAGKTYTPDLTSGYFNGSQTLIPGAAAITIDEIRYSLAPTGTALISVSSTIPIASASSSLPAALSIAGGLYSKNSASGCITGSQTLTPNGPSVTINSIPYFPSTGPSGAALIVGTSTSILSPSVPTDGAGRVITIGEATFTANSASDFVIDGQTLAQGAAITVSGTEISLSPKGTDVVLGTSTESVGLGGMIISGFGVGAGSTVTTDSGSVNASAIPVGFTGDASRLGLTWGKFGPAAFMLRATSWAFNV